MKITHVTVTPNHYTRATFDPSRNTRDSNPRPRMTPSSKSTRTDWCWTSRA